jgi:uncharacterized protein
VRFLTLIFFILTFHGVAGELSIPPLTSPVMDLGNFLTEGQAKDLSQLAYEIHAHQGPQITILTVPDLQGYAIEDFSIRVTEKWKLGSKEKDNGLLVVLSKAEREVRIEVGNGIEGEITDYDTARFTREIFPEYFKRSQFHTGLRLFLEDVAARFSIKLSSQATNHIRRTPYDQKMKIFITLFIGVLAFGSMIFRKSPLLRGLFTGIGFSVVSFFLGSAVVALIISFILGLIFGLVGMGNLLSGIASGHHRSRYGGGGFSGGWSGGGGGFSGGGSSGRW